MSLDAAEIDRQLADRPAPQQKWSFGVKAQLSVYFGLCLCGVMVLPNPLYDHDLHRVAIVIGFLGVWRYSWWMTHAVRARIYGRRVFPKIRREGDAIWARGWRPKRLHIMLTTYREHEAITERVIASIVGEIRACGVPAIVWLGSSVREDEVVIANKLAAEGADCDITLRIVRQNVPGKRAAIGLVLRAMCRLPVRRDEIVVFMDGDFVMAPGAISGCLPLFARDAALQAVTTDEEVVCLGPRWVRSWLEMRFAQRRLAMQSHALSDRVLTLTGRMSVFRAQHLLTTGFIRLVEADHLEHWLWGRFRFLSGDDKSTWYYLLSQNAKMLYVPDALGYTIEVIEGPGWQRMVQNFRRWSGNMLRNGSRAIALGPRRMPFFIWWCLVDQRIAMWTMLVSPMLAVSAAILHGPQHLLSYLIFLAVTRMALCLVLYTYARRVDLSFPAILYLNQLINASVKVYCLWRLAKQRWSNRGNQSAGFGGGTLIELYRAWMARYCTLASLLAMFVVVILYTGVLEAPSVRVATLTFGL